MQATWSNECLKRNRGQDGTGRKWPIMAADLVRSDVCESLWSPRLGERSVPSSVCRSEGHNRKQKANRPQQSLGSWQLHSPTNLAHASHNGTRRPRGRDGQQQDWWKKTGRTSAGNFCTSMEKGPQPSSPNTAAPRAPAGQEGKRRPIAELACSNDGGMYHPSKQHHGTLKGAHRNETSSGGVFVQSF